MRHYHQADSAPKIAVAPTSDSLGKRREGSAIPLAGQCLSQREPGSIDTKYCTEGLVVQELIDELQLFLTSPNDLCKLEHRLTQIIFGKADLPDPR